MADPPRSTSVHSCKYPSGLSSGPRLPPSWLCCRTAETAETSTRGAEGRMAFCQPGLRCPTSCKSRSGHRSVTGQLVVTARAVRGCGRADRASDRRRCQARGRPMPGCASSGHRSSTARATRQPCRGRRPSRAAHRAMVAGVPVGGPAPLGSCRRSSGSVRSSTAHPIVRR